MKQRTICGSYNSLNTAATTYSGLLAGFIANTAYDQVEWYRRNLTPCPIVIRHLRVAVDNAPGAGKSWTFTVRLGNSDTALTCQISGAATSAQDLTHDFNVNGGWWDLVTLKIVPSGAPTATRARWSVEIEPATDKYSLICGSGAVNTAAVRYAGVGCRAENNTTAEADVYALFSTPGKIHHMHIQMDSSPGNNGSYTVRARINGANTALAATMVHPADYAVNDIDSVVVAAGDKLSWSITPSVGPAPNYNGFMLIGMVFEADIDGESLIFGGSTDALNPSAVEYMQQSRGAYNALWGATEGNYKGLVQASTLKKLYVELSGVPGAGKSYTFTVRKNGGTPPATEFIASVDPTAHNDYGFTYPVTFAFGIPAALVNAKAYHKHSSGAAWELIGEKTAGDFFNGIEAVRFDYVNDRAYISLKFDPGSDQIYMKITDAFDVEQVIWFVSIPQYYDNRVAACVWTMDDVCDDPSFINMADACQAKNIWFTLGIAEVGVPLWDDMQSQINLGHCEASCHSKTHPHIPYGNYHDEIEGNREDILANLALPESQKKGASEYIIGWFRPFGEYDASVGAELAEHEFLADRAATTGNFNFAAWDAAKGFYYNVIPYVWVGDSYTHDIVVLKNGWDTVYAAGGIYLVGSHAWDISDYSDSGYLKQLLDYIANKLDVWYTGFEGLYMYHYAQERGKIIVSSPAIQVVISGDAQVKNNDSVNIMQVADDDYVDLQCAPSGSPTARDAYWGLVCYVAPGPEEIINAKEFPMGYYVSGGGVKELRSKVSGATVTKVAQSFPHLLLKSGKAKELTSKWS